MTYYLVCSGKYDDGTRRRAACVCCSALRCVHTARPRKRTERWCCAADWDCARGPGHSAHRVGVAFSEGPKLLPFYENLVKWQLLPLYAHILSVTFTVLPQTHNREAGATTARRRSRWRGRTAEWTDAPFPKECVSVCRARNAGIQDREVSCS